MKRTLLIICLLASALVQAQMSWQWGKRAGGNYTTGTAPYQREGVYDMASDNGGNIYTLCVVSGNGNPTMSDVPSALTSGNRYGDLLLMSHNCSGGLRWKKLIGGANMDKPIAVGTDTLGHVYISGYAANTGQATFPFPQPDPVRFDTDSTQPFTNLKAFFLAQYDTSGVLRWIRWVDSDTVTTNYRYKYIGYDMVVGNDGRVDIVCSLPKSLLGNSLSGTVSTPSGGLYILSYDVNGTIISLTQPDFNFSTVNNPSPVGAGYTGFGSLKFARTKSRKYIVTGGQNISNPNSDTMTIDGQKIGTGFVACFDSNWQTLWKHSIDIGSFNGRPCIDKQENIYLSGGAAHGQTFNGFTILNPLNTYPVPIPLIVKLDTSGNLLAAKNAKSISSTTVNSIVVTNSVVYATGSYADLMDWGNGLFLKGLVNALWDVFLVRLDPITLNAIAIDSLKSTSGYTEGPTNIVTDNKGNVYLGGSMEYDMTVNGNTLISAGGETDVFLAKYGSAACGAIVPLSLVDFTANWQDGLVALEWRTAGESNTMNFAVQRRTDAGGFETVGTVMAKGSGGQAYRFDDKAVLAPGNYYYRLVMSDKDGTFTFSNTISLAKKAEKSLQVYPNPITIGGDVHIHWQTFGNNAAINITDLAGKIFYSRSLHGSSGVLKCPTNGWPRGIYTVRLFDRASSRSIKLIIL